MAEELTREEIIERAEDIEEMLDTAGWKVFSHYMITRELLLLDQLSSPSVDDMAKVEAIRGGVNELRLLQRRPRQWIEEARAPVEEQLQTVEE